MRLDSTCRQWHPVLCLDAATCRLLSDSTQCVSGKERFSTTVNLSTRPIGHPSHCSGRAHTTEILALSNQ